MKTKLEAFNAWFEKLPADEQERVIERIKTPVKKTRSTKKKSIARLKKKAFQAGTIPLPKVCPKCGTAIG
ncbi:MAG: hypothetical protein EOP04_00755 [Proteobacteria bacterium]|nr:MAG: hypothetical protein EOP04_00755 [Pseudomonadota bacterium]